ncbi:hypothetical protein V6Z11_D12G200800 [Gossypium hirsutum]
MAGDNTSICTGTVKRSPHDFSILKGKHQLSKASLEREGSTYFLVSPYLFEAGN